MVQDLRPRTAPHAGSRELARPSLQGYSSTMWESGPRAVRERSALGLASVLHVTALLSLWAWTSHHPLPTNPASTPRAAAEAGDPEMEVEVDTSEPSSSHLSVEPADFEGVAARNAAPSAIRVQRSPPQTRAPWPANASDAKSDPAPQPEDTDPTAAEPAVQKERAVASIDLGLGAHAWQRWIVSTKPDALPDGHATRSNRPPLVRVPARSTTGGLQEGLAAQDRALGLGPSGAVISALFHAAHTSSAPEIGVARFQVTVLDSGAVEIQLSEASGNFGDWHAVATQAAEALRQSPPRIPSGHAGMRLSIELRAEEALPNGVKTRALHGPQLHVPPVRFRSTQAEQAELKERNPVAGENQQLAAGTKANAAVPGVYVAGAGKVCSYRAGLTILGLPMLDGGCDLSNIGARPQRMVHTRVREEVLF